MMSLPSMDTPLSQTALPPLAPLELSASHSCNYIQYDLAEAFCCTPFASLDPPSMSSPLAPSRKRRATLDLADEFSHFDGNWRLNDEISLGLQGLSQLITSDTLQSHTLLNDNYAPNSACNCNDLEDVLNFLWMEDDSASTTQSAASPHDANSDQISLISDLDLDYGSNESSSNQTELHDGPSSHYTHSLEVKHTEQEGLRASWQKKESGNEIRANWQKKEGSSEIRATWQQQQIETTRASWQGEARASWQGETWAGWQQKQGEFRASLEDETRASWQDETRASWQGKQEGARASWQAKQGVIRASWQQKQEAGTRASWQAPATSCKEERVKAAVVAVSSSGKQGALMSPIWAGPTLLEIESALAISGSPYTSPISTLCANASPTPSSNTKHEFFDVKKLLSNELPMSTGEPPEPDILSTSWRLKLQKRSNLEPKCTVKVESEEKALEDGYRWRKYGQKSIKNSPFPRSYYRCSNGKCNAKKQVEKCHEDGGLFLVTYEGIHLHHRPNTFKKICMLGDFHEDEKGKIPSRICSPSSSTSCSHPTPSMSSSSPSNITLPK